MNMSAFPRAQPILFSLKHSSKHRNLIRENHRFRFYCNPVKSQSIDVIKHEHKPGPVDDLLLNFFRQKMVEEIGWDSEKLGYDGLIEVANRLMLKGKTNLETEKSAVRVLKSLFPPFILVLFKLLISPIGSGKVASMMVARATTISCQWLMGTCSINSVELPDGSTCSSGVFVEKCKYLEESKCIGICINTCKLPTQTFFKDCMGVPLHMEPNFTDYSCQGKKKKKTQNEMLEKKSCRNQKMVLLMDVINLQKYLKSGKMDRMFKFGVPAPAPSNDAALREPCLEICPNANRRRELGSKNIVSQCPQV